jgi:multidrug efflux pump subunit AcrA (membrane-fusion protein)
MTFNVISTRPNQLVIDQQALVSIQQDLAKRIADLERLRVAIETLAQVNEPDRFTAAAMAFCNQLAARWRAERASMGFLKGRYVRLAALSHTEKFTRQMRLVQDLEACMEECLDQDVEVLHPAGPEASFVSRATSALATRHGPSAVLSIPLRRAGKVVAVLTLERKVDQPWGLEEIETLRLTCDLVTPRMVNLHEHDRWFGAKATAAARKGLAEVLGPRHTWFKAAAIGILAFSAFAVLAKGTYRIEAPFTFKALEKRIIPVPFDGYLKSVRASAGDYVVSEESAAQLRAMGETLYPLPNPLAIAALDATLATLDTAELENQLASAQAERAGYLKQRDVARRDGKWGEAQVAEAAADKSQADIEQVRYKLAHAVVTSPIDGVVFTGDLKSKVGTRLNVGEALFEVGKQEALRAELDVPEDAISFVELNLKGKLATASYPGERVQFTVESINPAADQIKETNQNVYKVRGKIDPKDLEPWMRPGMAGVAKIEAAKPERYAWIWTHRLTNWVRMKLWI